jgi:hypothetical protein
MTNDDTAAQQQKLEELTINDKAFNDSQNGDE